MSCEHVASRNSEGRFACEKCGVFMCWDCGCTPAHEESSSGFCRGCATKGGDGHDFVTRIDHDKLRALAGREFAARILEVCRAD